MPPSRMKLQVRKGFLIKVEEISTHFPDHSGATLHVRYRVRNGVQKQEQMHVHERG